MQFFSTLLASIASLSAYTLVGVHAGFCAYCPADVAGEWNTGYCRDTSSRTHCNYLSDEVTCVYTSSGERYSSGSFFKCPRSVEVYEGSCNPC
ncbi:hypothetical protein BDN67DRAFT_790629 [Paxillus ammoniavirescens]|nr:hypothetical protein BDN67DRAFT_790629 [Paxillus ammoniavirescens]